MRKLMMMLVVLLFCVGVIAATPAAQERRSPCVRHCHEEFREAERRCHSLPPAERERCQHEARERLEHCLRNCRD
jgi:hypothetical protein